MSRTSPPTPELAHWHGTAGFRYGLSVFEGIRVTRGERGETVFVGGEHHFARLHQSLRALHLADGSDDAKHLAELTRLLGTRAGDDDPCGARIFTYATERDLLSIPTATVYDVVDLSRYGPAAPARLLSGPYQRHARGALERTIKSPSTYPEARLALVDARSRGADDVVFVNEHGRATEATRASLVFIHGDRCLVPSLREGVLDGVTRRLVRLVAEERGLVWEETEVPLDLARASDAVLMTSSSLGVRPAGRLDDRPLDLASPAARALVDGYDQICRGAWTGSGTGNITLAPSAASPAEVVA